MTPDGMPIDLPVAHLEGRPFAPDLRQDLVLSRAYSTHLEHLRGFWIERKLRDRWLELRRDARLTMTHITPACVQAMISDGIYAVHLEVCFQDDDGLVHMQVRFRPVEPVTTGLLIASGFVDLWEERFYVLADALDMKNH